MGGYGKVDMGKVDMGKVVMVKVGMGKLGVGRGSVGKVGVGKVGVWMFVTWESKMHERPGYYLTCCKMQCLTVMPSSLPIPTADTDLIGGVAG